jgi:hypothetical protein
VADHTAALLAAVGLLHVTFPDLTVHTAPNG